MSNECEGSTDEMPSSSASQPSSRPSQLRSTVSQPLLLKAFCNIQSYSSGTKNKKITHGIMHMIVKDNLPFTFVEGMFCVHLLFYYFILRNLTFIKGAGFLDFMKENFPLYKVPTRNTIKAEIDKLYEVEKNKCVSLLSNLRCVTLTTDIWTNIDMKSMLGITVHGLLDTKPFNGTIGVYELSESHTASHISEILSDAMKNFSIEEDNVKAVVTDNARNIVNAIYEKFGKKRHIPCFAHTLNLVCSNSLDISAVQGIILKCKTIVKWFKRSVKANDDMRKVQAAAGVPEGKFLKLLLDVNTRWNSTYYMIERFIKLSAYVSQVLLNYPDSPPMITSREKDELMEICTFLRPLEAMTVQISGERHGTLSQIIPLVHCGHEQISKIHPCQPAAQKLKQEILKQFDKRFATIEQSFLLAASTILDPRFKRVNFKDPLALSSVLRYIRAEITEKDDKMETASESSVESEHDFDFWAPHKTLAHKKKRACDDVQPQDELTFYLNSQVLPLKSNVVDAWDDMKTVYPKLYEVSQNYCHLIGTSVPAERLFSKAGSTATLKRNRLTTKRLSKLLFLQTWLNKK